MTRFVNLTPHVITIVNDNGEKIIEIPPSGEVVRVNISQEIVRYVDGIPVKKTVFNDIQNLPEPQNDTIFIVSTIVLQALKDKGINRDDVVAPDTNSAVRDENGRIIGVKGFQVL